MLVVQSRGVKASAIRQEAYGCVWSHAVCKLNVGMELMLQFLASTFARYYKYENSLGSKYPQWPCFVVHISDASVLLQFWFIYRLSTSSDGVFFQFSPCYTFQCSGNDKQFMVCFTVLWNLHKPTLGIVIDNVLLHWHNVRNVSKVSDFRVSLYSYYN